MLQCGTLDPETVCMEHTHYNSRGRARFSSAVSLCDLGPMSFSPATANWVPGAGAWAKPAFRRPAEEGVRDRDMALQGDRVVDGGGEQGPQWGRHHAHVSTQRGRGSLAHQLASSMAISASHSFCSLYPARHKYGYICKCNHSIVLRFSALLDSSMAACFSPHISLSLLPSPSLRRLSPPPSPSLLSGALSCCWQLLRR